MTVHLPIWSASQIKQFGDTDDAKACIRRWAFRRVAKLPEPEGTKAKRGSALHREMEVWHNGGWVPPSKEARGAARLAPKPFTGHTEVQVRFSHHQVEWIGYIDLVTVGDDDVAHLWDYKFSTSKKYALSPTDLYWDAAANVYAYAAYLAGAQRVILHWLYTEFDKANTSEVSCEMERGDVELRMWDLSNRASDGNALREQLESGKLTYEQLNIDTRMCFAYGQVCPRKGVECNPAMKPAFSPFSEDQMASFEEETAKNFGGTLPPLPGMPSLPPLPPPPAVTLPPLPPLPSTVPADVAANAEASKREFTKLFEHEAGFVNPAQQLFPAASSPEEAVENGNVHVPETATVVPPDDLDSKTIEELRLIAKMEDVTYPPKARSPGIKSAIRQGRINRTLAGEAPLSSTVPEVTVTIQHPAGEAPTGTLYRETETLHIRTEELVPERSVASAPVEDREEQVLAQEKLVEPAPSTTDDDAQDVVLFLRTAKAIAIHLGCRVSLTFEPGID